MHSRATFRRLAAGLAAGLAFALAGASGAAAQILEAEPNQPCTSAQDLTAATHPATVAGSLDTPPSTPDVDFYRFSAPAGSIVTIRHRPAGDRPLGDPYLGILQSNCTGFLAIDDDGGGGLSSLARITVPADGIFVVAASSYQDSSFTGRGSSSGTYVVTVERELVAGSISGRLVNARTGSAVGEAYVLLRRCTAGSCDEHVGDTYTQPDGSFHFLSGEWELYGQPLRAGDYQLATYGANYQNMTFGPFHVGESQVLQLGDLPVTPLPVVGSVRGRAIDEITGAPLSGVAVPYATAELLHCQEGSSSCHPVRFARPDAQGAFRFESTAASPILGGDYRVRIWADQYEPTQSEVVTLADGQHFDFGDLAVKSFPVRIYLGQACDDVPAVGGTCTFTVDVANGNAGHLEGEVWNVVEAWGIGRTTYQTSFQVGSQRTLSLGPGASANVPFSFNVPGAVPNGAYICLTSFVGQRPHNFETLGSHDLFCLSKGVGGFSLVPEQQKGELMRALRAGGTRKQ